jgi:hypothetical protein
MKGGSISLQVTAIIFNFLQTDFPVVTRFEFFATKTRRHKVLQSSLSEALVA